MPICDTWIARPVLRFVWCWLTGSMLFIILGGCGDPNPLRGARLYPVKGKIVLSDGKPLTAGKVVFIETKTQVTSATALESDGGFAFKNTNGDGLPVGEYRVILEPDTANAPKVTRSSKAKLNLPYASKYTDEDGSDLKASVSSDESKNDFQFKLEPPSSTPSSASSRGGR